MAQQLRLFPHAEDDRRIDTLILSACNQAAWDRLGRWRQWPGGAMALVGPAASGKTHMARAWCEVAGAAWRTAPERPLDLLERHGRLAIDDADRFEDEAHLAALLDAARQEGRAVLLTAAMAPRAWPVGLRDLRSRLAALPYAEIDQPDDAMLAALLERLCRAVFIKLTDNASKYLTVHMERSFANVRATVEAIDRLHVLAARPVPVAIAARALRLVDPEAPAIEPDHADLEPESE